MPSKRSCSSAWWIGSRCSLADRSGAASSEDSGERVFASPLARKLAAEAHLDLARITGAGMGGTEGISLYVHIPFCRTVCPFCCFAS